MNCLWVKWTDSAPDFLFCTKQNGSSPCDTALLLHHSRTGSLDSLYKSPFGEKFTANSDQGESKICFNKVCRLCFYNNFRRLSRPGFEKKGRKRIPSSVLLWQAALHAGVLCLCQHKCFYPQLLTELQVNRLPADKMLCFFGGCSEFTSLYSLLFS